MRTIKINKAKLQEAYTNNRSDVAAASFGVSLQTFYNMLDKAGIERKRPGFKRGENINYEITD